jgi:hypothetical protein
MNYQELLLHIEEERLNEFNQNLLYENTKMYHKQTNNFHTLVEKSAKSNSINNNIINSSNELNIFIQSLSEHKNKLDFNVELEYLIDRYSEEDFELTSIYYEAFWKEVTPNLISMDSLINSSLFDDIIIYLLQKKSIIQVNYKEHLSSLLFKQFKNGKISFENLVDDTYPCF